MLYSRKRFSYESQAIFKISTKAILKKISTKYYNLNFKNFIS